MRIEIELDKGVDRNASKYFEKAKKLRKKITGLKKAVEEAKKRKDVASEKAQENKLKKEAKEKEDSRKKEWYEKFRWFISSDGFLVIGGKDATSNEIVIKKHTLTTEYVYHTEAPGSPFFVIKNPDGKEIPDKTREEAAIASATFSKAWNSGIKALEVYEVLGSQVTKEAKAGEYIAKGAFMVYGKRKYYDSIVSLAIGVFGEKKVVMSGPESAIVANCSQFTILRQGYLKKGEIAKKIMHKLKIHSNELILGLLPAGKFDLKTK